MKKYHTAPSPLTVKPATASIGTGRVHGWVGCARRLCFRRRFHSWKSRVCPLGISWQRYWHPGFGIRVHWGYYTDVCYTYTRAFSSQQRRHAPCSRTPLALVVFHMYGRCRPTRPTRAWLCVCVQWRIQRGRPGGRPYWPVILRALVNICCSSCCVVGSVIFQTAELDQVISLSWILSQSKVTISGPRPPSLTQP